MKFYIHRLGCPKNDIDADYWNIKLTADGHTETTELSKADLIIVNSCGFIDDAKMQTIEHTLEFAELKKHNRRLKLVVAGCMGQIYGNDLLDEIPELDGTVGCRNINEEYDQLMNICKGNRISSSVDSQNSWYDSVSKPNTFPYAYLKISEGCVNRCSYCVIPDIRGDYYSIKKEDIIEQAKFLIANKYKEIIVVAQDTTLYGHDIYDNYDIYDLIKDISEIKGDFSIRILYTHPARITERFFKIFDLPKVLKYLDMPIQHISDNILKAMGRKTDGKYIRDLVKSFHEKVPGIILRTSVMVGFPSETEENFEELLDFISKGWFLHVGAFAYSPQEHTKAFDMEDQIDEELKEERRIEIEMAHLDIYQEENDKLVGKKCKVIIEGFDLENELFTGRIWQDSPEIDRIVFIEGEFEIGQIINATIVEASDYSFLAEGS